MAHPSLAPSDVGPKAWTPEREARACRLYLEEGFSASEVARALGGGLSRGAVIGKVRRLGLSKRKPPSGPDEPGPRLDAAPKLRLVPEARGLSARFMGPSWPPQPLPPLREAPLQGPPAMLADLSESGCRWPIDDAGPAAMHATLFCAAPAGGRYCPVHQALSGRVTAETFSFASDLKRTA